MYIYTVDFKVTIESTFESFFLPQSRQQKRIFRVRRDVADAFPLPRPAAPATGLGRVFLPHCLLPSSLWICRSRASINNALRSIRDSKVIFKGTKYVCSIR